MYQRSIVNGLAEIQDRQTLAKRFERNITFAQNPSESSN